MLIITIILKEMKIKDLLLFGTLTVSSNCSSVPKLASQLDKSKCSVSEQGHVEKQCMSVREGLNSIYVQIEPLYGANVCEVSNLNRVLESVWMNLKSLELIDPECVAQFKPYSDLLDPVSDYALRSFAFLDALVLDFESVVGTNVGITDHSVLDPLFFYAYRCVFDLMKIVNAYQSHSIRLTLGKEDLMDLVEKLENLDKLLKRSNQLFCSY